jgi:hypothetical protein
MITGGDDGDDDDVGSVDGDDDVGAVDDDDDVGAVDDDDSFGGILVNFIIFSISSGRFGERGLICLTVPSILLLCKSMRYRKKNIKCSLFMAFTFVYLLIQLND